MTIFYFGLNAKQLPSTLPPENSSHWDQQKSKTTTVYLFDCSIFQNIKLIYILLK